MEQPVRRRVVATVVALALLVAGVVAAAPASSGIVLTPALDGATAVKSGMAVEVSGQVDLAGGSSFLVDAEFIGYDADGDEVVRGNAYFNANRSSGSDSSPEYIDIDAAGNVDGLLTLGCEFGDATSLPQDQVVPPCDGQTATAWDMQLVLVTPDSTFHSDLIRVDPVPPVVEGYEVTSPTTILVTVSEPVTHPTGTESTNDWVLPDGEAVVVGVTRATDDCAYGPGEDTRGGADGCTFQLTVSPALGRDATPRVLYQPSETRVTNANDAKHVDGADNSMYLRSVEPTRGDRFDSLAADRVGPVPPSIQTVAGQPATDPDTGERLVLGNDPRPAIGIGGLTAGHGVEVQVDGTPAASGTAADTTATLTLDEALADGTHTVTATASDTAACDPNDPGAGTCSNDSEPSTSVTYDLDTVAPEVIGDVLARSSTITVALSEEVTGPDDAADWTVSNPGGAAVTVDAVEDDGDGSANRRLRISGGPVAPGAELTYSPVAERYEDAHTNVLADVTVPLTLAELPVAAITSVTGDETEAGVLGDTTPVQFTVTLDEPVAAFESATVDYRTVALGSATLGPSCDGTVDAVSTAGTITFAAGEDTSDPVEVEVCADELDEFDTESVVLELSDPQGLRLPGGQPTAVGIDTITDDDPAPVVSFSDPSPEVAEGDSVELTVELDAVSGKDVTVDWTTVLDLSADEADLPQQSGTVSIPAGQATGTLEVTTLQDLDVESGERFAVELATDDTSNAVEPDGGARVQVDIVDDDVLTPLVTLSGGDVDEDARGDLFVLEPGTLAFEVELSEAVGRTVRVDYATTAGGTATPDDEFTPTTGTLEFQPGDTAGIVEVEIADDELDEFDETIELELRNPDGVAFPGEAPALRALGTILDDDPLAVAAFTDDSTSLGVAEGATADLTVELDTVSGKDVRVDWTTTYGGTASDADAPAQSGTVVVPAGATTATFQVTTSQDDEAEGDETFDVELTAATDGALADDGRPVVATITIVDDEVTLPTLTVTGGTVDEGAADVVPPVTPLDTSAAAATPLEESLVFTATLSEPAEGDVTVDFATVDTGSATAGTDYTARSGTVTIPAGETSAQVTIDVLDDTLDEFDELVVVRFRDPVGARFADGGSQTDVSGRITDDDPLVTVDLGDDVEVAEGEPATFTVTLSEVSGKDVRVRVRTSDGSARAGSDYSATDRTLTIPAGDTETSVTIPTLDDSTPEATEDVDVALSVVAEDTAELGRAAAVLRIDDDDLGVEPGDTVVSLTGDAVEEGDPGTPLPLPLGSGELAFEVSLSEPADGPVTIEYVTRAGTATADEDFTPASGSVTIPDGEDRATVPVEVVADRTDEFDEELQLVLTDVSGDAVLPGGELARTGRILDDDAQAQLRVTDATVLEGGVAELDVTLDSASGKPITVAWDLADGSATAGADYSGDSGTLSFPAGTTARTVQVATLADDDTAELVEQFELVLSAASNAGIDDARGTISIVDVGLDGLPTVTAVFLEDVRTVEADSDRTALVPVRLSAASDEDVTVTWTSQRLTAADGEDYVADGGQVVVPAGATSAEIAVTILGDDEVEPDEDFLVLLTEAEGAVITGPTGRVTIEDDDEAEDNGDTGPGDGPDGGTGSGDVADGAPDGEDRELAATGGGAGAGFAVLVLGLLAARRRREDD